MATGDYRIDALVLDNGGWVPVSERGRPLSLTYSFLSSSPSYYSSFGIDHGAEAMSASQQATVRATLAYISGVVGIAFTERSDGGIGDMTFALHNDPDQRNTSFAYMPTTDVQTLHGDVWMGRSHMTGASNAVVNVLLHEIGHALGLKHPGQYGSGDEGPFLPAAEDRNSLTVMSYTDDTLNPVYSPYDLLALTHLYGAPAKSWQSYYVPGLYNTAQALTGTSRNERFYGELGNDTINGGGGWDTALYTNARSAYSVSASNGTVTVRQTSTASATHDGTDTLTNVDVLKFSDTIVVVSDLTNAPASNAVFRFYNQSTGTHTFVGSVLERDSILANHESYSYEATAFVSATTSASGTTAVHRFFNTITGTHFMTASAAEKAHVQASLPGFSYDGVVFNAYAEGGSGRTPVYRFYNTATGTHFYTASEAEKNQVQATLPQFTFESTAFYVDL